MSPGLSPLLLRPLARVLARIDVDGHRFLTDLGIEASTAPEARVDAARVDLALDQIAAARGDGSFGITLATHAVSHPLGFFDHLVWPGATVRDAIQRSARFFGLLTSRSTLELEERDGIGRLAQHVVAGAPRGSILTDLTFGSLVLRARAAANGIQVTSMSFVRGAPDSVTPYTQAFGVVATFGAPLDTLVLERSQLDRPLGTADPVAAAALEAQALRLPGAQLAGPFLDDVRAAIRRTMLDPTLSLGSVAGALSLAPTTVQARLQELGTSLSDLTDEVRRDHAISLVEHAIPLADVATSVGLPGTQALHDAFVRWTGVPPGEWRTR